MKLVLVFLFLILNAASAAAQFSILQLTGTPAGYGGGQYLRAQNYFSCSPAAVQPAQYYLSGTGCPAVSTADYYHINGIYGMRPVDLTAAACGTKGASIAASKGRYAWPVTPDHGSSFNNRDFADGQDLYIGFSNDPGIPPATVAPILRINNVVSAAPGATFNGTISGLLLTIAPGAMTSGALTLSMPLTYSGGSATLSGSNAGTGTGQSGTYTLSASSGNVASSTAMTSTITNATMVFFPYLVCNPDDSTNPFYYYTQSSASSVFFATGVMTSPDLVNFTEYGQSHRLYNGPGDQATAMQIYRSGTNMWVSLGRSNVNSVSSTVGSFGTWNSSDGKYFTYSGTLGNSCLPASSPAGNINCANGANLFAGPEALPDGLTTSTGGQTYLATREDLNVTSNSNTSGQQVVLAPVDGSYNILSSPSVIAVSNPYCNVPGGGATCFPGPQFLSGVSSYNEGGIAHFYPIHGFFACIDSMACTSSTKTYASGGGLLQQFMDHYCYVIDATAAANAAPTGLSATASGGVVTLTWDGCDPGLTYKIYSGTTSGSQTTPVATVTGTSYSYTPMGSPQTLYLKVATQNGGMDQGSRVVGIYVSSSSQLVNAHINRCVNQLGADASTIDRTFLDSVQSTLTAQGLSNNLRTWVDPSFGVVHDVSNNVSVDCDLGTTRLPRGGDLTFCTNSNPCSSASTSVYSATAFGNGTTTPLAPGITNPSSNGFSYFGGTANNRFNNIRRMVNFSICVAYQKPGTALATLAGYGGTDFTIPTMTLQHTSGTPGSASFTLADDVGSQTITQAVSGNATDPHVMCGTFDTTGATSPTSAGTLKVYEDHVFTGSPNTMLHSNIDLSLNTTLLGAVGQAILVPVLTGGSTNTKAVTQSPGTGPISTPPANYVFEQNEGNYIFAGEMIFDVALTQAQVTAITNLYLGK